MRSRGDWGLGKDLATGSAAETVWDHGMVLVVQVFTWLDSSSSSGSRTSKHVGREKERERERARERVVEIGPNPTRFLCSRMFWVGVGHHASECIVTALRYIRYMGFHSYPGLSSERQRC